MAGDRIPSFTFETRLGARLSDGDLAGRPAVLVFIGSDSLAVDRYLTRVDDTFDRLGSDAAQFRRLAVLFPGRELSTWERDGWTGLAGGGDAVREFARHFGAAEWGGPIPAQMSTVTVIDSQGLVVHRLGGLATWNEMDLLIALDAALVAASR